MMYCNHSQPDVALALGDTSIQFTMYFPNYTVCVSNCSLDGNEIGPEGGMALGGALAVNQTLQELR